MTSIALTHFAKPPRPPRLSKGSKSSKGIKSPKKSQKGTQSPTSCTPLFSKKKRAKETILTTPPANSIYQGLLRYIHSVKTPLSNVSFP